MMTYSEYKSVPHLWDISIPSHWKVLPLYAIAKEKSICNCTDLQLLSVYLDEGLLEFQGIRELSAQPMLYCKWTTH